ncbi:hypothetical protein [uncultured Megasphaera sp.]|uniref:gp53-like domain-containing protein n=1 Tax=uncultured Megasphaera sp. TaxID=165188 RepID=UPI00266C9FDA|nr:hypothetical protein [uncultured Megasphaera sp.]
MANWQGFTLTEKGLVLQAKINAGIATLKFTKLSIGSGSSGSNSLTDLVQREKDLTIASCIAEGDTVKLVSTITNTGVTKAFKERELGLFALDPDDGEIMFAYMVDADPDTMPAEGSTTVISKRMTLNITFSNTGNVTAVLDSKQLVTFKDLDNHNTDAGSHEEAFEAHNEDAEAHTGILQSVKTLGNDILKLLAQTTLITIITSLQTDSWFGQLLKMVLTASGVRCLAGQNGYLCLGSFFGGIIIQWVYSSPAKSGDTLVKVDWPISFPNNLTAISLTTHALNVGNVCWLQYDLKNIKSSFYIAFENPSPGNENSRVHCIGIGW